ncbi:MAG TPA: S53 family peptidase [Solirubrobacteraceae bacterium]
MVKRSLKLLLIAGCAAAVVPAAALAAPHRAVCPGPASAGHARCHAHVVTDSAGSPKASRGPTGYGPAQFHGAYSLPTTGSTSQTIAIVDAYNDPTIASDLNNYDTTYGLPPCTTANGCFTKLNQNGLAGSYPSTNAGWSLEIALDVETAHQICQNCKVMLVEANSSSLSNLNAAENTAVRLGATEISNSWGGGEYSSETADQTFNHPGVAITVASGDNGYGTFGYPAASPYVVAVGGTTLNVTPSNGYVSESAWSGTGSGCSSYEAAQSWQRSLSDWAQTGCGTNRGVADVAADADPNTGAAVYDTTRYQGRSGWFQVGGTSLSSPLVAGVFALAGGTSSVSYAASIPYSHPGALHDVTSGSSGSCGTIMCNGGSGYDGPTGLGTPNGLGAF